MDILYIEIMKLSFLIQFVLLFLLVLSLYLILTNKVQGRIKLIIINKSDLCLFKDELKNFRIDSKINQILFSCKNNKKDEINFLKENFLF